MRLLVGFFVFFAVLFALQSAHTGCSMSNMVGVEWLECLAK